MSTIATFLLREFPGWVLRASWQGTALALVVLVVQFSLGGRLAARWRNALWLLVFARLLIPVLPQARISAYNLLPAAPPAAIMVAPAPAEEARPAATDGAMDRTEAQLVDVAPAVSPSHAEFHFPRLPYLWLAGALVTGAWSLAGHLRLRRRISRLGEDVPEHLRDEFELLKRQLRIRRADLIISKAVPMPLVTGFWRARVILPTGIEIESEPGQVRMVLLHELAHIKRGDLWLAWLGWLAAVMHWFNPGVSLALSLARKDREMACDEWVLQRTSDAKSYGLALLHFVKLAQAMSPFSRAGTIGIVEGRAALFQRMARIANWRRPTLIGSVAGFTLLVVIGVFTLTGATTKVTPPIVVPLPPQEVLIGAIFKDDPVMAEQALKDGAKLDLDTEFANKEILDRNTPVCLAAEQGRFDLVRLFVAHGASLKPGKNTWSTPIDMALRNGFPAIAVYLHDHGATTDPLIYAAGSGDVDAVNKLTASGTTKTLNTAAALAAAAGQTATLGVLLAKGADAKGAFGRAASAGSVDSMRFLLAHGVDIQKAGYDALGKAAYYDHPAAVAFLLGQHVNPNRQKQPTDTRFTEIQPPLNQAASGGSLACVKLLLDAGADPNSVIIGDPHMGDTGTTPIDAACDADNPDIVRLLLDHGAPIEYVDSGGFTPALYAAYCHGSQCLALLIDRGANVKAYNAKWKLGVVGFAVIFDGEDDDRPDMHDSVAQVNRDMATLQVLLDRGIINANTTTGENFSILSAAVTNGQTAWMEKLLQMGAKVNTVDDYGGTPLTRAFTSMVKKSRELAMIDELLAKGADPNAGGDSTKPESLPYALKAAITRGPFGPGFGPGHRDDRRKIIGILIAHGARFRVPPGSDAEKMLLAATTGDAGAVGRLLAKGVSPNVADSQGWTPLLSAAALRYDDILKELLDAGANVNAHDAGGDNALIYAMQTYPDLTTFHLLLNKGADVRSLDLLESAIMRHDPDLLRDLLKHGASPNIPPDAPEDRFEPLELAVDQLMENFADQKRRDVVTTLIAAGANRNPKQVGYRISLLYFPVENNMIDMVKFLLQAGIDPKKDMDGGKALSDTLERHGSKEMKSLVGPVLAQNGNAAEQAVSP